MGVPNSVKIVSSRRRGAVPGTRHPTDVPELAGRLRLAVTRLARRLRREAVAGVSPSQLTTMSTLARTGRMTLGELASAEGVRPPTMTKIVAGLESEGLARREADPVDGRVAWIRLTQPGERLVARGRSRKNAYLTGLLKDLPTGDRAALARAVTILERLSGEAQ